MLLAFKSQDSPSKADSLNLHTTGYNTSVTDTDNRIDIAESHVQFQ